jgi:hypothetical protein
MKMNVRVSFKDGDQGQLYSDETRWRTADDDVGGDEAEEIRRLLESEEADAFVKEFAEEMAERRLR